MAVNWDFMGADPGPDQGRQGALQAENDALRAELAQLRQSQMGGGGMQGGGMPGMGPPVVSQARTGDGGVHAELARSELASRRPDFEVLAHLRQQAAQSGDSSVSAEIDAYLLQRARNREAQRIAGQEDLAFCTKMCCGGPLATTPTCIVVPPSSAGWRGAVFAEASGRLLEEWIPRDQWAQLVRELNAATRQWQLVGLGLGLALCVLNVYVIVTAQNFAGSGKMVMLSLFLCYGGALLIGFLMHFMRTQPLQRFNGRSRVRVELPRKGPQRLLVHLPPGTEIDPEQYKARDIELGIPPQQRM